MENIINLPEQKYIEKFASKCDDQTYYNLIKAYENTGRPENEGTIE